MGVTTEAWAGWYEQDGIKEPIAAGSEFTLLITAADGVTLYGSGIDGLGSWTWKGQIDSSRNVLLEKLYVGGKPHDHVITYTGTRSTSTAGVDTIDGTWKVDGDSGSFQLQKQPYALEESYTGYYEQDGTRYPVTTTLYTTPDNKIYGSGSDDEGDFTWTGEIDPGTGKVTLHKLYLDSTVSFDYTGTKSLENGRNVIQGLWGDASANNKFFLGVEGTPYTGPWTGYYVQDGQQHPGTNFTLDVAGSSYTGHGYDDIGEFIWEGGLVGTDQVVLRKKYLDASGVPSPNPDVVYNGTLAFKDGKQVIDGTWNVPGDTGKDLFHFELPSPPPDARPFGIPVSIRSTGTPNAYLRIDGPGGVVNLQVGRFSYERFELVLQGLTADGEEVYAIKSLLFNQYLRLDPTVSEEQKPSADSPTFHPKGVGRSYPVKAVDDLTKFTVRLNSVDGFTSHSLRLVNSGLPDLPNVFLRLNADNIATDKSSKGSGEVNGQTYIGPYERLLIEPYPY